MNASPGAARRRRTAAFGSLAVAAALLTSACAAGREAQTINQHPAIQGANAQLGSIAVRDLSIAAPTQGTSYPAGSALRLTAVFVNNGEQSDVLTSISSSSFSGWGAYSSISDGDQVAAAAGGAGNASAEAPTSSVASSPDGSSPTPSSSETTTVNNSPAASASDSGATTSSSAPSTPASSSPAASAPQGSKTVRIPSGGRTSFGVPDATGALLVLGTKSRIYPGSTVTMTLTFARAGTVTVSVPVQITSNPTQATVAPPSGQTAEGD